MGFIVCGHGTIFYVWLVLRASSFAFITSLPTLLFQSLFIGEMNGNRIKGTAKELLEEKSYLTGDQRAQKVQQKRDKR